MNMIKVLVAGWLVCGMAMAYEYGPDPGYDGAPQQPPGTGTGNSKLGCASAQCHTSLPAGGPINSVAGGSVTATFSGGSSYTPGGPPITITVNVSDPKNTRFGFQMSARLESNLATGQAGTFTVGDPNHQLVMCDDGSPRVPSRKCPFLEYIEHAYPAGSQVSTTPYTFTWTPPATNVGKVHFFVSGNAVNGDLKADANDHVYTAEYILSPGTAPAPPVLTTGSLANGATYLPGGLVPGSWGQVKGTGLSSVTRIWADADFVGLGNKLPTNLSGVQVNINNLPAAIYYIDSGQVSFQVPTGVSGDASIQVINNGVSSNTISAPSSPASPGIFPIIVNSVNYPAAVFLDGKLAGDPGIGAAFRKAKPGESVQLYATGLTVTPAGVIPTPQGVSGVTVTIGTTTVPADFAGLVAVGEFQINFIVPQLADGTYPISIAVNGVSSPTTIGSNPPGPVVLPVQR